MNHSELSRFASRKARNWETEIWASSPSSARMGASSDASSSRRTTSSATLVEKTFRPRNWALKLFPIDFTPASVKYSSEVTTAGWAGMLTLRRRVKIDLITTSARPRTTRRSLASKSPPLAFFTSSAVQPFLSKAWSSSADCRLDIINVLLLICPPFLATCFREKTCCAYPLPLGHHLLALPQQETFNKDLKAFCCGKRQVN